MKCTLVVNQLNDPFYIDYDEDFAQHVIKVSKDKQLLEKDAATNELDANLVMQLFSPLILSQWLLIDQTKEPCSSVICQSGFIFIFKHVDGLLFVAINGDGTETEEFLHRKMQVFIRLMKFLFGPVSEEIGESKYSKKSKWDFLRNLMNTWLELVLTEQAFLVEAIERLNVNQLVSEKCIDILERAVKHMHTIHDQPTQHAVMLVNSKLLALYSNRNAHELRPKDVLSLMILSKTMYPRSDHLEDLFSKPHSAKKRRSTYEDNSDGVEDEYHSAPATPSNEMRSRSSSVKSELHDDTTSFDEEKQTSVSISDTETIINSLNQVSSHYDFAGSHLSPVSEGRKTKTLMDMYREKRHREAALEEDTDANKTDTSEDLDSVDHAIVRNLPSNPMHFIEDDQRTYSLPSPSNNTKSKNGCIAHQNTTGSGKSQPGPVSDGLKQSRDSFPASRMNAFDSSNPDPKMSNPSKCNESLSQSSPVDASKNRSRSSTVSSERENDSAMEGWSRSSSALSNASKTYPELLLQTNSLAAFDDFPASFGQKEAFRNRGSGEATAVTPPRRSPEFGQRAKFLLSTVEESGLLVDTMQNLTFSSNYQHSRYVPQTVFLETSTCLFSPHNIHTAQVLPGVTILFLSQAPRHSLADALHQVMCNIQDLIYGRRVKLPRSRSLHVYEIINSLLSKLHHSLKKFKGKERHLISDIHARWEKDHVKQKLLEYLEKDSRFRIPPELESPLSEMYKRLRELFSLLYLYPPPETSQMQESLSQLRVAINAELLDYREYVNVKSQRNITMTSYFEKYPGLIYFIFVDRRHHQMTAPSINISLNAGEKINACSYLKENIWRMYQLMMTKVTEGYTTIILREGDFYYSHFLWFEDSAGNPIAVQDGFKPSRKFMYPGVLCDSFYNDLISQCFPQTMPGSVHCFQMFLMHVGSVHPQYIAAHCKKLSAEMWEMSGEAFSIFSLF